MTRRKQNRLCWQIALCLLPSLPAYAQDDVPEVDEPAGELPPVDDDPAGDLDMPQDPGPAAADAPAGAGPRGGKDAKGGKDDDAQDSWDSYTEPAGTSSVAQEITGGVRVEDIVEPPTDYRYAAFGKPDPFVPPMVTEQKAEATAASPLEIPIVSPLQRYRLAELKLVGIWQLKTGERKAMVLAQGQGIIVKNGDPIGNRGGRILGIGDTYLTVREFSLAPDGTRQFEDHQMYMGERPDDDVAGKIRFKPGEKDPEVLLEDGGKPVGAGEADPLGRQGQRGDLLPGAGGAQQAPQGQAAPNGAMAPPPGGAPQPPEAGGPVPANAAGQPDAAAVAAAAAAAAALGGQMPPGAGQAPPAGGAGAGAGPPAAPPPPAQVF